MQRFSRLLHRVSWRVLFVSALALSCLPALAESLDDNWPQWRGPLNTGVAPRANPPTEWSETKNVKWKVKIPGGGSATPAIWGDKVFVLTAIATGKKGEPTAAVADGQNPRPGPAGQPSGRPRGQGQPGQPGQPPGGPGGARGERGGSMSGNILSQRMFVAADKDNDKKLTREEFTGLANVWFTKLDPDKTTKLDQEKFVDRFGAVMAASTDSATPNNRDIVAGRLIAPRLFAAADANKDGTLTSEEWTNSIAKWFAEWDSEKSGSINEERFRGGLNAALPQLDGGGPGGGPPGPGGPGGFGGGGMAGPPPTEIHQFAILCLDRQTGKVLWQQVAREEVPHEGHHRRDGSFAAPSPITDGKHVFAYFGSRGLYCYDMAGKLVWNQDFGNMRIAATFGEGSSPTLTGETIVVNWDHEGESFIIALDKNTGATRWKKPRDERTSWSTPLVIEHEGKKQVVTTATGKIRSYDLETGELVWECRGLTPNVIPTPVAANGIVYCISGFRGNSLLAIKLGRTGDLTDTDAIAWRHNRNTPYVPSPLLYDNNLYFFASNNGILSSFDVTTGRPSIDAQRLQDPREVYASPVGAGGRVYLVGRDGATLVIKNTDKLEVLAKNRLDEGFDASPAIAGNELYLRGHEFLYCIAEK